MTELMVMPINDIEKIGSYIAKSGLFGIKTPDQAIALCLIAQAEGKHPATAAQEYNIIQGRPALKSDAMLARFQQAGGKVNWKHLADDKVVGVFTHSQGGSAEIEWTIERARKAGLGKNDVWSKYPRQMLRARVISEGIRTVYPGVAVGVYTPEEVQDFDNMKDVTISPTDTDHTKPKSPFRTAALRNIFCKNTKDAFNNAKNEAELIEIMGLSKEKFDQMDVSGAEADQLGLEDLRNAYKIALVRIKKDDDGPLDMDEVEAIDVDDLVRDIARNG